MGKFGKFIGWLFFFAMQAAYDTFVIWGFVNWKNNGPVVSNLATILLIAIPTVIVINLIVGIPAMIFSNQMFKKDKDKKDFKMPSKVKNWFKDDDAKDIDAKDVVVKEDVKEEDIEKWFKENLTEEKVEKWFKDKFGKT